MQIWTVCYEIQIISRTSIKSRLISRVGKELEVDHDWRQDDVVLLCSRSRRYVSREIVRRI